MPSWKKLIVSGSDAAIPSVSTAADFTIDAGGDIVLDADGTDIILKDGGTSFGRFKRDSSDFVLKSETSGKDIVFRGTTVGGVITALTLDMSDTGHAKFLGDISGSTIRASGDFITTATGSFGHVKASTSVFTNLVQNASGNSLRIKAPGNDVILDTGDNDIQLHAGGSEFARLTNDSNTLAIKSTTSNADIVLNGVDSGANITALRLDMSESGDAYFNNDISGSTIRASGDVIAFNSSDERLKDNVTYIHKPIDKINQIGGYEFDWNDKQQVYSGHDVGVLAQEIEKVIPEAVKDRDSGYKGVQYDKIIPLLIEGIKELTKKTKKLEREIKKLKHKK